MNALPPTPPPSPHAAHTHVRRTYFSQTTSSTAPPTPPLYLAPPFDYSSTPCSTPRTPRIERLPTPDLDDALPGMFAPLGSGGYKPT